MTRDYKPASRSRKTPSSGSGSSLLVGILIGLLLGLGIALAVAIYLNRVPGPFLSRGKTSEPSVPAASDIAKTSPAAKAQDPASKPEEKRRFDFYEILPGADGTSNGKSEKARSAPAESKDIFYLQAGAFQGMADADNMKARLAMLGIEASIQTNASPERGTLHRVRIGPFSRVEEVNRTRETLKQNGIDSTLIKGRTSTN
ncbi:MAG: SPOR domain-containing protein [Betaproteobacteria bacterium]|nr:MAG: SPOR domain-containing protein [Betaproteobacteria bacterium]